MELAMWSTAQVMAALLACLGLYLVVNGVQRLLQRNPEQGWQKLAGRITVSEIVLVRKVYQANIRYTYAWDGQVREGSGIAPIESWSSHRSTAAHFVDKYPVGCEAVVYLDPTNPSSSVLEPGQQPVAAIALTLTGVAMMGFGYFGWLAASL